MVLDRNTSPYYDDSDPDKKYVQILFRPGLAVQARELSQMQSAIQTQIDRFGKHIFKEGSMVLPGEIGIDNNTPYIKLEDQFNSSDINVSNFLNKKIIGTTSGTTASVIDTEAAVLTDPNTLYLKYETGVSSIAFTGSITSGSATVTSVSVVATNSLVVGALVTGTGIPANTFVESITDDNEIVLSNSATATNASASLTHATSDTFLDGETIVTDDGTYSAIITNDSNGENVGFGSRVKIQRGVYFALGYFLLVDAQTIILDKYGNTPSYKVGLRIIDSFVTENTDVTLVDPATGSPNFNAPGAHRYKVDLVLSKYGLEEEVPENFIELLRVKNGSIQRLVTRPDYSELEKTLARRTNDESGNYVVKNFPLQVKEHLDDGTNNGAYTGSNGGDASKLALGIEPGKAYVQGYEIESSTTKFLETDKARTTERENNVIVPVTIGNYITVNNVKGLFNITTFEEIELLDADKSDSNYPGTTIGTAKVRGVEFVSGTPGATDGTYRINLFDIRMNEDSNSDSYLFSDVKAISDDTQSKDADVILNASNEAFITDTVNNTAIFNLPDTSIKTLEDAVNNTDTSYTVKRFHTGTMTGNSLTLTGAGNEIFSSYSATNYQVSIVSASGTATGNGFANGDVINLADAGNSVTLTGSPNGRQVIITIPDIAGSSINVISTLTKDAVSEKTKTLTENIETISHASFLQLEKADIFKLKSVVSGGNDITDRYILDNGQRDNFYDRGSLSFRNEYTPPAGSITITYDYFEHGAGDYFSVDSYDGVIDYEDIQTYRSPSNGKKYDLRDAIDFRPRVNDAGTGFSVLSEIVASGQNFRADYDYYLPRVDKIILDSTGKFTLVKGIASKYPLPPSTPEGTITLYELDLPAYTYETSNVSIKKIDNKRYTMHDIGKLEKRIESLEYYSSLNLLEKDTADLFVDDGTGANRFKSGFLVDNFTSHLVGDVGLLEYACSIDKELGLLRPQFASNSVPVTLSTGNSSNYAKTGDLVTLPYTTESLINQPYASKTENINPYDVFNWVGQITLTPESDEWYESEQAPDRIINNDDGLADSLAALNGQVIWNDWQTTWVGTPLTTQTISSRRVGRTSFVRGRGVRNIFEVDQLVTAQQGQTRTGIQLNVQATTNTQSLGDRVINTEVIPWIRENTIEFECSALKPNTQVYPFFDNVNVSEFTTPTGGSLGDDLITNNNGFVSGTFKIPNSSSLRFRTGERIFKLTDSDTDDRNFATTSSEGTYTAKGILETKQETILSTRSARVVTTTVDDERTIIGQDINTVTRFSGWFDPLAQTFLIDSEGGAFLPKIDIFFATKDTTGVPVTLQIRNVVNGYPGPLILPFSDVTINPEDVITSTDGLSATSFTFDSPVYLEDGQEYCFVLLANSIEYTVWCSRIGEFDISTGERISEQPYAGVMFKSQNASTWTADQEQDIKFNIHRCVFDTEVTGTAHFRNDTLPSKRLPLDPFFTTDTSGTVLVNFPNHGLQDGETVTISNADTSVNGIPFTDLNDDHVISYVDFDTFNITVGTNATSTGVGGGFGSRATGNYRVDTINPLFETISLPGTSMGWGLKVANTSNVLHTNYVPFEPKSNVEFTDERFIFNTNEESANKSLHMQATFSTDNPNISPVIDLQRASAITIANRINNTTADELLPTSGDALARYITKKVALETPAETVRVYFAAVRPPVSTIKVYVKYLEDTNQDVVFDDLPYTELETVSYPNGSEIEFRDYIFELTDLPPFSTYAIKIVMASEETSDAPLIRDFRTIAFGT